ncbi:MAG: DUF3787 domain-containing protein [Clostridiaceae bacterium]|jgi:hypothetical protein|nr:DUF3787 domain-containing protein [Clostridiaceae bacterium]
MSGNRKKEVFLQKPIERHDTASWADLKRNKPVSKVIVPMESGVINAKEYVDMNQK